MRRVLLSLLSSLYVIGCFANSEIDNIAPSPKQAAINAVVQASAGRTLSPVEGVWQAGPCSLIAIIRKSRSVYDIILYSSDDLSISLPVKIGEMTAGARPGLYDTHIARRINNKGKLSRTESLAVTISDNGSWLEFEQYKKGVRVNLSRLIPYMFRHAIQSIDTRPNGLTGARRVYPDNYYTDDNPLII